MSEIFSLFLLCKTVGGKWLMGLGVLVTAVFTLLTPLAANTNLYLLYTVRIIEGLGEGGDLPQPLTCYDNVMPGVTVPAIYAMIARWAAPQERSR